MNTLREQLEDRSKQARKGKGYAPRAPRGDIQRADNLYILY